jgi:hypothetical protein
MRRLKRHRFTRVFAVGHAFAQNIHYGYHDIAADTLALHRLRVAFDDLVLTV